MTLKDAIEREARQGKLINHARRREGRQKGLFVRAYCIQTRCNLVLILADGKTARRGLYDPSISGGCSRASDRATDRPTDRPTCRSAVGVSVPRGVSCCQPVHSLFAYKAAHVHVHERARVKPCPTKEIIAKGTESYLAEIVCFQRTRYSCGSSAERSAYV